MKQIEEKELIGAVIEEAQIVSRNAHEQCLSLVLQKDGVVKRVRVEPVCLFASSYPIVVEEEEVPDE